MQVMQGFGRGMNEDQLSTLDTLVGDLEHGPIGSTGAVVERDLHKARGLCVKHYWRWKRYG